jgi:SAM-dependent methyltransferase
MTDNLNTDNVFTDAISVIYDRYLVPLMFEPYADALARRLVPIGPRRVLEIAAGTGVVTRALATALPETTSIIATDLNKSMLDQAVAVGTSRPVDWCRADALQLPFDDGEFDAVVCQFGVMFFTDKPKAFAEARRVLRDGGVFLFSVWDRIEENEFADIVSETAKALFPDDPPSMMSRTPHGYFERDRIERDLVLGGFTRAPKFETVAERSRADSALVPAIAYCQGTPVRRELEARGASRVAEVTEAAARAIRQRFGEGEVDGKIQAHIITAV